MEMGIRGKLALVVGASKSIGREVLGALKREGATVIGIARSEASNWPDDCDGWIHEDLMKDGAIDRVRKSMVEFFGMPDIIFHAIGGSMEIKDAALPWSEWAKVQRFNLGVCHDLNREFIPFMRARQWGRIVHTSSDAIKCHSGSPPYTSAKHAVEGYVRTMSKIVSRDNVIISAIRPGNIFTPHRWSGQVQGDEREAYFDHHAPIRRFGLAEEVAAQVVLQCSVHASYMAGAITEIDGGSR